MGGRFVPGIASVLCMTSFQPDEGTVDALGRSILDEQAENVSDRVERAELDGGYRALTACLSCGVCCLY